jgi:dihydroorotase
MLRLVDEGVLSIERLVELMCHAPARIFHIAERGFLREGAKADLVLLRPNAPWTLHKDMIISKCGWSPLEGETFNWSVEQTYCNGHLLYNHGFFTPGDCAQALRFER